MQRFLFLCSTALFFALSQFARAASAAPAAVTVLVELSEPPVARYVGGIAGLSATSPSVTGVSLLTARREEVARYRDYLETRQDEGHFGLTMLSDLVRDAGGRLELDTSDGTTVRVEMPR